MESDATVSPVGMGWNTASSPTTHMEPDATTPPAESSGVAANATKDATQDRNSPLSADEEQKLARIRKDRANRFMVRVRWPTRWLELWAERAAIMGYQGNLSRETAEVRAEIDVRKIAAQEQRQERTA